MKKITVSVQEKDHHDADGEPVYMPSLVTGYTIPGMPALAITSDLMWHSKFTITHIPSGASFGKLFYSINEALKMAKKYLKGINWDKPREEIWKDSAAMEAIKALRVAESI
ncbi:MAG: hypothetical protein ABIC04_07890 [Nanoarchaeota archaeon]